jgi:phage protein U
MASSYLMKLGDFRFSLHTAAYEQLQRSSKYRWKSQERVGRLPGQQYLGPGDETITLSGVIYAEFLPASQGNANLKDEQRRSSNSPIAQLNAMRAEAGKGKPLTLVDGTGQSWQQWVINQVEETQRTLFPDGTPRLVEFRLQLNRYGEDV